MNGVDPGQKKAAQIEARTELAVLRSRIARLSREAERHGERSRFLAGYMVETWGMTATVEGLLEMGFPTDRTIKCLVSAGFDELDVELVLLELGGPPT